MYIVAVGHMPIVNNVNKISWPVAVKKSKKKRRRSRSSFSSSTSSSRSSSSELDEYVRRRHKHSSKRKGKKKRKREKSAMQREVCLLNSGFGRENILSEIDTNFVAKTVPN